MKKVLQFNQIGEIYISDEKLIFDTYETYEVLKG